MNQERDKNILYCKPLKKRYGLQFTHICSLSNCLVEQAPNKFWLVEKNAYS